MITKQRGEFVAECNECGEEFAGGTEEDFKEFVAELKASGWRILKDGEEWQHICPDCQEL